MKEVRYKSIELIFKPNKKVRRIEDHVEFDKSDVDVSKIQEDLKCYAGFLFVLSIYRHILELRRIKCTYDDSHCQGVGPQSYGTFYQLLSYDMDNQLPPSFLRTTLEWKVLIHGILF